MKLGEALSERARLQGKIGELRSRINANAIVEEGSEAPEDVEALLADVSTTHSDLASLIARINLTNARTLLPNHDTLTEALAERERLKGMIQTYGEAARAAQDSSGLRRYQRSELRQVRTLDVKELRTLADEMSMALRQLDNQIQEINWTSELED